MIERELQELLARFSDARIVFPYFKDRYAAMLLSWYVQEGRRIREIKASQFRGLLQKPSMRRVVARASNGVLPSEVLERDIPSPAFTYTLTLGSWGCGEMEDACCCCQTTRPGRNLVLLLNFPPSHNEVYERLVQPGIEPPFVMSGHPQAPEPYRTMAWARIDLDIEAGEALIEEVQGDWIRYAQRAVGIARSVVKGQATTAWFRDFMEEAGCEPHDMMLYWSETLLPHAGLWQEAMLSAALWFLVETLGIRRIFYHTYEGGTRLKAGEPTPPRSLYEHLPRSFGFVRTEELPAFLRVGDMPLLFHVEGAGFSTIPVEDGNKLDRPEFYVLDLDADTAISAEYRC